MATGLLGSFLEKMGVDTDEDYDYDDYTDDYDEYDDVEEERLREKEERRMERERRKQEKRDRRQLERESAAETRQSSFSSRNNNSTSNRTSGFRTSTSSKVVPVKRASNGVEVCIVKTTNFGDSQEICEILLSGRTVIVNFESIDRTEAQRIMDFSSGCVFSIGGSMRTVTKNIFVFAPAGVDVSGDYIVDMVENEGFAFPKLER